MTSAPAIGFEYKSSRVVRWLLIFVGTLAVLSVALCAVATWLKWLLPAGVLVAVGRAIHRAATSPVVAAGWSADNSWTLHLVSHEDVPATLASFRVLGLFVLLRLQTTERGVQVLLLAPDNSDRDIRRRLRMRLATLQPGEMAARI
jgi:toxin CptA